MCLSVSVSVFVSVAVRVGHKTLAETRGDSRGDTRRLQNQILFVVGFCLTQEATPIAPTATQSWCWCCVVRCVVVWCGSLIWNFQHQGRDAMMLYRFVAAFHGSFPQRKRRRLRGKSAPCTLDFAFADFTDKCPSLMLVWLVNTGT